MYIVEKIGDLILITIENDIYNVEVSQIKSKLQQLSEVSKDDVVVSIYSSTAKPNKVEEIESEINDLLKYCDSLVLRVYSYKS